MLWGSPADINRGAPQEVTMNWTGQQTPRNSDSTPAGRFQPANNKPGDPKGTGKATVPPGRTWLWFLGILLANYLLMKFFVPSPDAPVTVPYTLFKEEVSKRNVEAIHSQGETITGRFKTPVMYPAADKKSAVPSGQSGTADEKSAAPSSESKTKSERLPSLRDAPKTVSHFTTTLPSFVGPGLEAFLIDHGVEISAKPIEEGGNPILNLLFGFGPALLFIGFYIWMFRRAAQQGGGIGGLMGIGKSRARRYDQEKDTKVTFDDVAGIDEAENELVEVVDFLKDPSKYTRLGGAVPKGVLLVGAPGTGKTLLARAVAGEANVPFFSMGASEFVEMIVGVGASRVRDLFKQAREAAPAIIFIDELDAIGRARGTGSFGGNDEREQTLNQTLTEMDGFSSREGVIVLAATNRPDVLDQALLRPGRFDRRVTVNPPDKIGREAILKVHTRGVPLASDVDLKIVAASTPGLVGADLRNLVNEAALTAARRNEDRVHQDDFLDALEKLILGPARNLVMSSSERERVAYHEGGHTILGLLVPGADPVNRVTIMPRGQALGVTYQRPEDDRHNYSEEYLRARITGAMGGRAAEEIVYGGRTTGSESDMQQATDFARQMVTRWGMSERLGPVTLAQRDDPFLGGRDGLGGFGSSRSYSEATAKI